MNWYEQKQEERKERYEKKARGAAKESDKLYHEGRDVTKHIPFGQPILVGHHSEKKHRGALKRADSKFNRANEESSKADHYASKAAGVGHGGISSDDPDVISKLKEKLKGLEDTQEHRKHVNKVHRAFIKNPATLDKANVSESVKTAIRKYKAQYSWEKTLYPSYSMQNGNGNISSVKKRIAALEALEGREDVKKEYEGFTYLEEDNRHQFLFDGKPEQEIRTMLKQNAFKWSPTRGAWVRKMGGYAKFAAENVIKSLGA